MTPLAPFTPYILASLSTSIRSTSPKLTASKLLTSTSSSRNRGVLLLLMEFIPLIFTEGVSPKPEVP